MRAPLQAGMSRKTKGMTIVELLIIVLVIGILATIGLVQYRNLINRSREAVAVSNLVAINRAQQNYYLRNDRFADSLDALQLRFSDAYSYQIVSADAQSFVAQAQYGNSVVTINEKGVLTYSTVPSASAASSPSPEPTPSPAPDPTPIPAPSPSAGPSKGPPSTPPGQSKRN